MSTKPWRTMFVLVAGFLLLGGAGITFYVLKTGARTDQVYEPEEPARLSQLFRFRKPPAPGVLFVGTERLTTPCASASTENGFAGGGYLGVPMVVDFGDGKFRNDLDGRSSTELKSLSGLSLSGWSPLVARQVAQMDPRRTCFAVDPDRVPFQELPPNLAMLLVWYQKLPMVRLDFSRFTDLRYLNVRGTVEKSQILTIDAASLRAPNLEYLRLAGHIENAQSLSQLTSVWQLDLEDATGLEDLEFVRRMKDLESLLVRAVEDLRPMGGLAHLTMVDATNSKARELPMVSMPSLRKLELLASQVPPAQVDQFQHLNPQCRIRRSFNHELQAVLEGAREVRILPDDERPRAISVASPAEIAALRSLLKLEEEWQKGNRYCRCLGGVRLEIVTPAGIERISPVCRYWLRLEGESRIASQWPTAPALMPESLKALQRWVEKQGARWECCGDGPSTDAGAATPDGVTHSGRE